MKYLHIGLGLCVGDLHPNTQPKHGETGHLKHNDDDKVKQQLFISFSFNLLFT